MTKKTIRTRLNYYRVSVVLFLLLFMVAYTGFFSFLMIKIFVVEIEKSNSVYFLFLPIILFSFLTIIAFITVASRMNYTIANEEGIKIIYPMKFRSFFISWNNIKGYSKSDYYYGGRLNLESKSLIIYTRSKEIHEIIKLYNFDFQNFQSKIRNFDIVCFGYEGFVRSKHWGLKNRFYKYQDLFN